MSKWFEHPISNKLLTGDQVLDTFSYAKEAKEAYETYFCNLNSKESPLNTILKLCEMKGTVKKEWFRRVLNDGPIDDKLQAMKELVETYPMYSLYYLDHMISLVDLSKKRFSFLSSSVLTKIFTNCLLPKTRPLINLNQRPLSMVNTVKDKEDSKIPTRKKILCYWYFEEQLKTRYMKFIKNLENLLLHDPDRKNKNVYLKLLTEMCECKENQSMLIEVLVNKLGDKSKEIAGKAFSKLNDIGLENNIMIRKVIRSVRKFVFRPNLETRAQYYAIQLLTKCKINKKFLSIDNVNDDEEEKEESNQINNIPIELVQIYIGILKRLIDSGQARCEKLYTAVMTGMSRILPFTKQLDMQKYMKEFFIIVHSSNLGVSVQGLKVLFTMIVSKSDSPTNAIEDQNLKRSNFDRYMQLVYSKLLDPSLFFSKYKATMLVIVFKSIAVDKDSNRVKAIVKRLLQSCLHHFDSGFICCSLIFLSRLIESKHKSIFETTFQSSVTNDVKLPVCDTESDRKNVITVGSNDSDEEFPDIVSDNEEESVVIDENQPESVETETKTQLKLTSWDHRTNQNKSVNPSKHNSTLYDPFARNPKFANAENVSLGELRLLKNHVDPTVRLFATKILNKEKITYDGDPMEDFSLIKFLDRFAYKNPKNVKNERKYLQKPPKQSNAKHISVNTKEFADMNEEKVPVDQLFFHKYFNQSKKNSKGGKKNEKEIIDSDFSDSDTEFDKFIMRENMDKEDELNLSDSEMEDLDDEDVDFSDFTNEDMDFENLSGDESMEENEKISVNETCDMDQSKELDGDDSDESDDDSVTIHSSKRRRLGQEMSSILAGTLSLGKSFENIREQAVNKKKATRRQKRKNENKTFVKRKFKK